MRPPCWLLPVFVGPLVVAGCVVAGCGAKSPLAVVDVLPGAPRMVSGLALGGRHSCARFTDGTLRCWGSNSSGQLGDGTRVRRLAPTALLQISDAAEVALGGSHTCAIRSGGAIQCWGNRSFGQVGEGIPLASVDAPVDFLTPTHVTGLGAGSGAVGLALGEAHSCATFVTGKVMCWGSNDTGELGNGRRDRSSAPTVVSGIDDALQVAAGGSHVCARLRGGRVKCWGAADFGQLGAGVADYCGSIVCTRTPVLVAVDRVVEIAARADHTCARKDDGTVLCWGEGVDRTDFSPRAVPGVTEAVEIAVGDGHACVRRVDGSLWCWGSNASGQLGFPTVTPCPRGQAGTTCSLTPQPIPGVPAATQIALGGHHTCARFGDGRVRCWGANADGQLGDGTTSNRGAPTAISP